MASNLTMTYPPATGVSLPATELSPFGNNSASTQDSLLNYVSGTPAVTTPVTCYPDFAEQCVKGIQEYPR
jgi:hypothetical protein